MEARLKFRIWNPKYNEFNYWGFIDGHFKGPPTGSRLTIEECSKSDRYTGLKDKNGVEIFEGDVLKFTSSTGESIARVVWYFDGWQLEWIKRVEALKNSHGLYSTKISTKKLNKSEVIGHIYDPKYSNLANK